MRRIVVTSLLVALAATALALPVAAMRTAADATTVTVKMSEFKFVLSRKTVPKGSTTFVVTNVGKLPHDFKIAGKKTPIYGAGKKGTLSVKFTKAGKFPYLCTVPGHAAAGMKGVLTVK